MDLDFLPSPPPVEDILAARRAKRLAILAKYSAGDGTQSQSPSSAVQPPLPSSSLSDTITPASASASAGIATNDTAAPVSVPTIKRNILGLNGVIG
jgi:serine/threonine-protein kinase PRP4